MKQINHTLIRSKLHGPTDAMTGHYRFLHPKIKGYLFNCLVSMGMGWEHVSITLQDHTQRGKILPVNRCPTWPEMCLIKEMFWSETETVVQFHPPKSDYVNNHEFCLHLWKPTTHEITLPHPSLVGIPDKK